MKYYIKVITGFREDQYNIISMQEAHKAYYLFKNPTERGVFENGVALVGKNIHEIQPAWNETMGWNPTHELDDNDWNEIDKLGVGKKMRILLGHAKEVGDLITETSPLKRMSLIEAIKLIPQNNKQISEATKQLTDKFKLQD